MRWITKFLQKKISDRSKVGKRKTTNRPKGYNLRLQQRSTKGLQSLYGFGELPGQPRSRDGRLEARPKPTFHLLHTTILQLELLSGGCTARAGGVRQSRSLRERAASSVATNRSTIGARAWSRYRRWPLSPPVLRLFCEGRELGTTCLLWQQLLSRHRNDPESVTGMQTTAGGGESGGGGPQYPHHVPMDLHVPQHFPYYAG